MADDELAPPKRVLAVSARFTARPELVNLLFTLKHAGVTLDAHASIEDALARAAGPPPAECLMLDASFASELPEARLPDVFEQALGVVKLAAPHMPLVLMVANPTAPMVAAAYRAGASDCFDPAAVDKPTLLKIVTRARADHLRRTRRASLVTELRKIVDEFLRQLVRAEKRVMELEESIAAEPSEDALDVEKPPRVLVVDDEVAIAEMLVDHLGRSGLDVTAAHTGERALELIDELIARKEPLDLAMVDKKLPGMDGLQVIRELRKRLPSLPTMVMTGFSTPDVAVAAADLGVVGYVLKPFDDVRELSARVKQLAARYAAERRQRRHLARIKQRHAQFLEQYVSITQQLDSLKG
jgi:DNA-binding NtrC family response regulator